MKKVAFVIERPLQFLIFCCILDQLKDEDDISVHIADVFHGASKLYGNLCKKKERKFSVFIYDSYRAALMYATQDFLDNLFIHWDIGFRTDFRLAYLKYWKKVKRISVFEEGLSIERKDIYKGIKKNILRSLGFATHVGGNRHVDELYLFDPTAYKKTFGKSNVRLVKINKAIHDVIRDNERFFHTIFEVDKLVLEIKKNNYFNCALYLTDWRFNLNDFEKIKSKESVTYLKPHPYIQDSLPELHQVVVCAPDIPAEIVISLLSSHFDKVTVFHHGSSVPKYISFSNVKFVKL